MSEGARDSLGDEVCYQSDEQEENQTDESVHQLDVGPPGQQVAVEGYADYMPSGEVGAGCQVILTAFFVYGSFVGEQWKKGVDGLMFQVAVNQLLGRMKNIIAVAVDDEVISLLSDNQGFTEFPDPVEFQINQQDAQGDISTGSIILVLRDTTHE